MNVPFLQSDRRGRLTTSLGSDALVLLRLDGTEEMSGDFEWRVEALSADPALDLEALLGTHATVAIDMMEGTRQFDGIVCEAAHAGSTENGNRYDLVLRPWLHVAGLRRNQRIFHRKTVVQTVEELFADYAELGDPHLRHILHEDYPVLEYTVQYGETDADFARRMLERFGISWSWEHGAGSHTLLLTDDALSHPMIAGGSRPFHGVEGHHMAEEEHFRDWSGGPRITTGAVRLTEYNFKTPHAAQEVDRSGEVDHPKGEVESFDWPGDYLAQDEGKGVVGRRLGAERGQAPRHRAKGDVAGLGAGTRVTVSGDDLAGVTGETFLCLKATHRFRAQAYGTGETEGDARAYDGDYVLLPDNAPFRPERRTPRPVIRGPQTAVVVGEGEIDCDEYGRILVRYHWDLDGKYSMRCRVSQNWAGRAWGGMVIPRIGMEVIVEHLLGDPDKPIVTGCVYNAANMPPYELPRHKTRSTFRSDTHKGQGFNEIRFEDEKDEEEIFVHAEKDRNEKIKNNHTERIDNNWVQSVGGQKVIEVDGNHHETVLGSMTLHVGRSGAGRVLNAALRKVVEGISGIGANLPIPGIRGFGSGILSILAEKAISESTPGVKTQFVGITKSVNVGRNITEQAGHSIQMTSGSIMTVNAGDVMNVTSGGDLHLTCGESRIYMHADGYIRLSGKALYLNFEEGVEAESRKNISLNATRIDLN